MLTSKLNMPSFAYTLTDKRSTCLIFLVLRINLGRIVIGSFKLLHASIYDCTCKHLIGAWWSRHQVVDPPSSVVSVLSTTTSRGALTGVISSHSGTIQLSACVPILHSQWSLTVFPFKYKLTILFIVNFLNIVAALCNLITSEIMF